MFNIPEKWNDLYNEMPEKCRQFIKEMESSPDCMGLGKNNKLGWFIAGSGQGPSIYWSEK